MVIAGGMDPVTVAAGEFKGRCLALLDEVARSRQSLIVTKHGRPVAKVVPLDDAVAPTMGSVHLVAADDDSYFSTGERWAAGN